MAGELFKLGISDVPIVSNVQGGMRTFVGTHEERLAFDRTSLGSAAGVQLRLAGLLVVAGEGRQPSNAVSAAGDASATEAGRLDGHGLAHDRAAVGQDLQLGEGAAAGRRLRPRHGRRHGPQAGRRRLLHEGAHGLGLAEDGVHGGAFLLRFGSRCWDGLCRIEG